MSDIVTTATAFSVRDLNRQTAKVLETCDHECSARILKAALIDGEIDRTTTTRVAGVSPATGTKLIRKALAAGLLSTPSPKGALRVVFDANVLESYFPKLYQDLPV